MTTQLEMASATRPQLFSLKPLMFETFVCSMAIAATTVAAQGFGVILGPVAGSAIYTLDVGAP